MAEAQNPLLHYRFDVPFDAIAPAHVEPAVDALLARSTERLTSIKQHEGPRTYENTLGAFDAATEELEHAMSIVGHLESVATTPELREAYNAVQPKVSSFYSGVSLDADLYRALKDYAATEEARALDAARARFLKQSLDDFRGHGIDALPSRFRRAEIADFGSDDGQLFHRKPSLPFWLRRNSLGFGD